MPDYFAAFLDLRGRRCLVVGGGPIGERKVRELLACGARVTVVSSTLTPELGDVVDRRIVRWRRRTFLKTDLRGHVLAIAATGIPDVDDAVAREARRRRALINVVDRPGVCDFIVPSVLRRGQLQIAVSTGGRSPALAREIRRRLEPLFGPSTRRWSSGWGEPGAMLALMPPLRRRGWKPASGWSGWRWP